LEATPATGRTQSGNANAAMRRGAHRLSVAGAFSRWPNFLLQGRDITSLRNPCRDGLRARWSNHRIEASVSMIGLPGGVVIGAVHQVALRNSWSSRVREDDAALGHNVLVGSVVPDFGPLRRRALRPAFARRAESQRSARPKPCESRRHVLTRPIFSVRTTPLCSRT
jgi:hypothetical protein